jgi:hypothetical protein
VWRELFLCAFLCADPGFKVDMFGGAGVESVASDPALEDLGVVVNSNPELGLSLGWTDEIFEVSVDLKNAIDDTREAHVSMSFVF